MTTPSTVNADLSAEVPTFGVAAIERYVVGLLNDERDVPFVYLMVQCWLLALSGIALFFAGDAILWLAPIYLAAWALGLLDRFILMLHCTSHRVLFKNRALNHLIPWTVGPFFGQTPESYFVHHMGMHHPENNLFDDLSTTMPYQRDTLRGWLAYYLKFIFGGLPALAIYHYRGGRSKMFKRLMTGELAFWLVCGALMFVNWKATLVVFVLPVLIVRTLMMCGNWGQHAFVDASDPGNPYRNSITCINTRYNRRCFNDGYHILHHIKPRTHFTEYPIEFESNRAKYGSEDAIVFEGIDFFQVWVFLMTGNWSALVRRFVRLPGAPERNDDEVRAFLQSRVHRIAR